MIVARVSAILLRLHPITRSIIMTLVTIDDRKKELRILLDKISANPSQALTHERERVVVLQQMIAAAENQQPA